MSSFGKAMAREHARERAVKQRVQEILGFLDGMIELETQEQNRDFVDISENRTHAAISIDTTELNELMINSFSLEELKDICYSLGISYDELPHATRREISRELIDYVKRRQMLSKLLSFLVRLRPDVDWL